MIIGFYGSNLPLLTFSLLWTKSAKDIDFHLFAGEETPSRDARWKGEEARARQDPLWDETARAEEAEDGAVDTEGAGGDWGEASGTGARRDKDREGAERRHLWVQGRSWTKLGVSYNYLFYFSFFVFEIAFQKLFGSSGKDKFYLK